MKHSLKCIVIFIFCFSVTWTNIHGAFVDLNYVCGLRGAHARSSSAVKSLTRGTPPVTLSTSLRQGSAFSAIFHTLLKGNEDGVKFRCDYQYCRGCNGWLKYHSIPATFNEARLRCDFEGAILASPISPELSSAMTRPSSRVALFTGIHSTFSQGDYATIDGTPLEEILHEWIKKDPKAPVDSQNNPENCVSITANGGLADVRCDVPRPYMCFREKIDELNTCGTPDSEYRLDSETHQCYKFHTIPRTFQRAYMACSAEGGHLLIIDSDEESKAIVALFEHYPADKMVGEFSKDNAFVGVHDWNEHGDWRTIHGKSLTDTGYDKFVEGGPGNLTSSQYCATVTRSGELSPASCDGYFPFVCEKRPDYPPVCAISV